MALSFPLTRSAFMDKVRCRRESMILDLPTPREVARTRGGTIHTAETGEALWQGAISLVATPWPLAQEIRTLLTALEVPGRAFDLFDVTRPYPLADPDGAGLSGVTTTITAHTASTLTIAGLPNGYQISVGDYVSFAVSGKRYLHRFNEGATVAGGSTGAIEVQPFVRATVAGGTSCTLQRPYCRAVTVPGSVDFGKYQGRMTYGIAFEFQQTLES